jgi:anti-sigma regulatory factor (Ser/Thr protein kinase)
VLRDRLRTSHSAVLLSGVDAPKSARLEFESFAAPFSDDIEEIGALLVSEIVTNSVVHGPCRLASVIELHFTADQQTLRVEVTDEGDGFCPPPPRPVNSTRPGGRGLGLVATLATAWGVSTVPPTSVWFELRLKEPVERSE